MTIHRFYLPNIFFQDEIITLPQEISHQIAKVLHLQTGDTIIIFSGDMKEYEIVLTYVSHHEVSGKLIGTSINTAEPTVQIVLYQGLLPREKFEEVLQKATEIGVSEFIPLKTSRTIVKDISESKQERWQKIVLEAAEQSERGAVPKVNLIQSFEDSISTACKNGEVLIAWEEEKESSLTKLLADTYSSRERSESRSVNINSSPFQGKRQARTISLFVGPEGGFDTKEIEFAKLLGAKTVSLGKRILRSETAGIIFPSLVLFMLGNL